MGIEISEVETLNYINAFDSAVDIGIERFNKFWLLINFIYKFTDLKKREDICFNNLHEMSKFILSRKRKTLKSSENNNKEEKNNFLEQMLYYSDALSEKEIIDEIHTMIIAGSDTTFTALHFALILIGSYPKVQEKIKNELKNIFGDSDRDVQRNDLAQMTYLEAVVKETMRYYVTAPFMARHIDKEIKLKNCTLKPGNDCFILLLGVHRHGMWGADADQFLPERWLDKNLPSNLSAYMPFGSGKRNCIGRSYAMMSIKTTLCQVLRRYKIRADHTQVQIKLEVLIKAVSGHHISIENN